MANKIDVTDPVQTPAPPPAEDPENFAYESADRNLTKEEVRLTTVVVPIAVGLVLVALILVFCLLHRRRRNVGLSRRLRMKHYRDLEWSAVKAINIEAALPELSPQYSNPKDHIHDALSPLHRVPSESSWRDSHANFMYHDHRASLALQEVPAAEDTMFLDNELYEASVNPPSTPEVASTADASSEDLVDQSYTDYVKLAEEAETPPEPPSPISSDRTTTEDNDERRSRTCLVEYYCSPLCQENRHDRRCPSVSSSADGYDPVYVPRHDAEGMARRVDKSNYVQGRPRSVSRVTNAYEDIDGPGGAAPDVPPDDLDVDVPYGRHNFLTNGARAEINHAEHQSNDTLPENIATNGLDEKIPLVQNDSVPEGARQVTLPPVGDNPPKLPLRKATQTNSSAVEGQRFSVAVPQISTSNPLKQQPRAQSWAPKGVTRSDSNCSDYESYDFTQSKK